MLTEGLQGCILQLKAAAERSATYPATYPPDTAPPAAAPPAAAPGRGGMPSGASSNRLAELSLQAREMAGDGGRWREVEGDGGRWREMEMDP